MAGMGGGMGSVLHMIITLRNNRNLLRKSNRFKRKRHYFELSRDDYLTGDKYKIEKIPLSAEEREKIRNKTRKENRASAIKTLIFVLISSAISVFITIVIVKEVRRTQEENSIKQKEMVEEQRRIEHIAMKKEYAFYIKDGDAWLNKKHYNNAIYQYKLAKVMNINGNEAQKRLMIAYSLQCVNEDIGCAYVIYELGSMIEMYPNDIELYELLINCKEFSNDTSELNKYYNKVEKLIHKQK